MLIIKEDDKVILENLGYIRLGKEQMRRGGKSDPRNARTWVILSEMNDVEALGINRTRRYRLREKANK